MSLYDKLLQKTSKSIYLNYKRTSDQAYVVDKETGNWIPIEKTYEADLGLKGDFYVHLALKGSGWVVSEGMSGSSLSTGTTMEVAVMAAKSKVQTFIKNKSEEAFYKLLLTAKEKLTKENPRYIPALDKLEEPALCNTYTSSEPDVSETYTSPEPITLKSVVRDCLNYKNTIDVDYISEALGLDSEEVENQLLAEELVFYNPENNLLEAPDEYLSGNVRDKLSKAADAAINNPMFIRNVEKLKEVQPEQIPSAFIQYSLGAAWIPKEVFEKFATDMFKTKVRIQYLELTGKYSATAINSITPQIRHTYLAGGKNGLEIFNATLNNQQITITETKNGKSTKNLDKTAAAQGMQEQMQDEFQAFIRANRDIEESTEKEYNEIFNSHIHRDFKAPDLTHYPGASEHYKLRLHQRKGVLRAMKESTLFAHEVGLGKTGMAITTAMELRRLELAIKPIIVVQKKTYGHFVAEFHEIYPNANILAPTDREMTMAGRPELYHKIRDNDWDCIIMPHSQFDLIPDDLNRQIKELQQQLDAANEILGRINRSSSPLEYSQAKRICKSLEKELTDIGTTEENRKQIRYEVAQMTGNKVLLNFEELGIDALLIDECFPYETPILTTKGMMPIGFIVDNKLQVDVLSFNESTGVYEPKPIINWLLKPLTRHLVKITHSKGSFVCTENHKIFTDIGYVEAKNLNNERAIKYISLLPSMRVVQTGHAINDKTKSEKEILFQRMSRPSSISQSCNFSSNRLKEKQRSYAYMWMVQDKSSQKQEKKVLLSELRSKLQKFYPERKRTKESYSQNSLGYMGYRQKVSSNIFTYAKKQSDEQSRSESQGASKQRKDNGKNISCPGREWSVNSSSSYAARGIRISRRLDGMGYKNSDSKRSIQISSIPLQSGHWYSSSENFYRGGWKESQAKEVEILRSQEDGNIECVRVESCEVYERGDRCGFSFGSSENERVYDLTVKDNHNYFAAGVLVSNCHRYKRLGFASSLSNIKGVDTAKSSRSQSMLLKMRWIQQKKEGGNTFFYTGTPISNTMAEVWTMMRYVRPDILKRIGIEHFDQFAKTFGQVVPSLEMRGDGTFKIQSRFAKFQNVPELVAAFRECADIVFGEDVSEFTRDSLIPKLSNGQITQVIIKQSPELADQIKEFRGTLEWYEGLEGVQRRIYSYIPLVIYNRAKQASIDLRLLSPANVDSSNSKINQVIRHALRIYHDTGLVQMIFSDLYQSPEPKEEFLDEDELIPNPAFGMKRFNLFVDIKNKLIAQGVKADEIAILTEPKYAKVEKMDELILKANRGQIKFLLGTTEKLGVGVNAQKRLIALHHADAPNRPMDFGQRNGRILRQKNLNKVVDILAYGVEKTLDSAAFQRLATKQRFINQIMKGENLERIMEDAADEVQMTFDELSAVLSDSPHAQQKLLLENRYKSEKLKKDNHFAKQVQTQRQLNYALEDIGKLEIELAEQQRYSGVVKQFFADGFIFMQAGKEKYTEQFGTACDTYIDSLMELYINSPTGVVIGSFLINDVKVGVKIHTSEKYSKKTKGMIPYPVLSYTCPEIGIFENIHGSGRQVHTNQGMSLINDLQWQIDLIKDEPDQLKDKIRRIRVTTSELERTMDKVFDETRLNGLEVEIEVLKGKMLAEKNKVVEQDELMIE